MPVGRVIKPKGKGQKPTASKPKSKATVPAKPTLVHSKLQSLSFGCQPAVTADKIYLRSSGGASTGAVNTRSEISLQVVDYFDYFGWSPGATAGNFLCPVTSYFWRLSQNLFNNNPSPGTAYDGTDTVSRVRKFELWVMPKVSIAVSNRSNSRAMFTVNVQVPAVTDSGETGGTGDATVFATNTQVTNVLPTINPRWKKVMTCNLDNTFRSGVYRPFFAFSSDPATTNQLYDQCLLQLSITDPDSGDPYYEVPASPSPDSDSIKFKIVMHVDQPIQPINEASLAVYSNDTFARPNATQSTSGGQVSYPGTSEQYCQMGIKGILNRMN